MTTSNEHNNAPAVPQGEPEAYMVYGNYTRQPFRSIESAQAYMGGLLKSDPEGGYHIRPLFYATPAAPSQEPAVPQGWAIKFEGNDISVSNDHMGCIVPHTETVDRKMPSEVLHALCRDLLAATKSTVPAQYPSEMTLRDYAEALIEADHDFWKACRRDAGGGAVRWLSCDDGKLIVFTRVEYRDAIMKAVGGYRATDVIFEDQEGDEQNGMVACDTPAQEPAPTWSLREALQKAKDALSLALSDVDWRKDSPTQPVIHKAYNCAHQALALPTAEQVDDINVAESFTSVTKTAAPVGERYSVKHEITQGGYRLFTVTDSESQCSEDVFPDDNPVLYGLLTELGSRAALSAGDAVDAQRLDFIEKSARCDPKMDGQHVWWPTSLNKALKGPTLRAAIDAAMRKGQP